MKERKAYKYIYFILNIIVIFILVREIILGNNHNALLCAVTLISFLVPNYIENKFKLIIPSHLKIVFILFIFVSEILGEVYKLYITCSHFDTILHFIGGFYIATFSLSLINLLNKKAKDTNLSSAFIFLFTLSFSLLIGVLWEFFEYSNDKLLNKDMQKDLIVDKISTTYFDTDNENNPFIINDIDHTILYSKDNKELLVIEDGYLDLGLNDTIYDLFADFIGAFLFSIFASINHKSKNKYTFINKLKIKNR